MSGSSIPRVRMFAGPNGSGKSTAKAMLRADLLKFYINADDIEASVRADGFFDFESWQLVVKEDDLRAFLASSTLLSKANLHGQAANLTFRNGKLYFESGEINSYFASVLADFVRRKFVAHQRSFTFETVMSSPDKIEFLRSAQKAGFRTYLYFVYFVATQSPKINIDRVANRVLDGGHDVPHDKIIARYHRSLGLLSDAIGAANRAYIFDNSGSKLEFIAEYENGKLKRLLSQTPPSWFVTHALS